MPGGFSYRFLLRTTKIPRIMAPPPASYNDWSKQDLIARLRQLERSQPPIQEGVDTTQVMKSKGMSQPRKQKAFNFAAHPRRKIALKFCYDGSLYCGLEFQKGYTPLPSVEGVLYNALAHTRLIDPEGSFDGCGWEKCGRTDRGVSAAQQVISLWVRSALKAHHSVGDTPDSSSQNVHDEPNLLTDSQPTVEDPGGLNQSEEAQVDLVGDLDEPPSNTGLPSVQQEQEREQEIKYISTLNNVLPPSIRILAWSPVSPDFSARFNCRYRHYKYFFHVKDGENAGGLGLGDGLDVKAMQDAADRLVGEHDFRNLCKVDPSKQLTSFKRKILKAEINRVHADLDPFRSASSTAPSTTTLTRTEDARGGLYVFDLVGTAFLYNQVRHIMAILFLVGTGLERPSLVSALLNVDPKNPYKPFRKEDEKEELEVVETKPEYQMADGAPLVLWECGYAEEDVQWRNDRSSCSEKKDLENLDSDDSKSNLKDEKRLTQRDLSSNLHTHLSAIHAQSLIHTNLYAHFLKAANLHGHSPPPSYFPVHRKDASEMVQGTVLSVPLGGGRYRRGANYVAVLQRKRGEEVETVNERWREGKGRRRMQKEREEPAEE